MASQSAKCANLQFCRQSAKSPHTCHCDDHRTHGSPPSRDTEDDAETTTSCPRSALSGGQSHEVVSFEAASVPPNRALGTRGQEVARPCPFKNINGWQKPPLPFHVTSRFIQQEGQERVCEVTLSLEHVFHGSYCARTGGWDTLFTPHVLIQPNPMLAKSA